MWPVPIQALLVMRMSPGCIRSGPISRRKWRTVAGRVPMNDGMLPLFCASAPPRASVSMHAKSLASLDSVENDVRTMALAASSTTEMMRVHSTSSVTASSLALTLRSSRAYEPLRSWQRHHDIAGVRHPRGAAGADHQRRAFLFHHRRAADLVARLKARAIVHRRLREAARL